MMSICRKHRSRNIREQRFPENLKTARPVSGRSLYVVEHGVVTVLCRGDVERGRAFAHVRGGAK